MLTAQGVRLYRVSVRTKLDLAAPSFARNPAVSDGPYHIHNSCASKGLSSANPLQCTASALARSQVRVAPGDESSTPSTLLH